MSHVALSGRGFELPDGATLRVRTDGDGRQRLVFSGGAAPRRVAPSGGDDGLDPFVDRDGDATWMDREGVPIAMEELEAGLHRPAAATLPPKKVAHRKPHAYFAVLDKADDNVKEAVRIAASKAPFPPSVRAEVERLMAVPAVKSAQTHSDTPFGFPYRTTKETKHLVPVLFWTAYLHAPQYATEGANYRNFHRETFQTRYENHNVENAAGEDVLELTAKVMGKIVKGLRLRKPDESWKKLKEMQFVLKHETQEYMDELSTMTLTYHRTDNLRYFVNAYLYTVSLALSASGAAGAPAAPDEEPDGAASLATLVRVHDGLFAPEAAAALLDEPLATRGRGARDFSLRELVEVARMQVEEQVGMGPAAQLVDVNCVQPRMPPTRWDVRLTPHWVERMAGVSKAFRAVHELALGYRARCGMKSATVDWHVVRVDAGSDRQPSHQDAGGPDAPRCYLTLIVPLTDHPEQGGTQFADLGTVSPLGGAVAFGGRVDHRGTANRSAHTRFFLYAAVHSGDDPNC